MVLNFQTVQKSDLIFITIFSLYRYPADVVPNRGICVYNDHLYEFYHSVNKNLGYYEYTIFRLSWKKRFKYAWNIFIRGNKIVR